MNSFDSSLKTSYPDRHPAPLSKAEAPVSSVASKAQEEPLREGQTIRGEILNRTTTDVSIRLSNGTVLDARLDSTVPLSIGQTVSFEVTQADSSLIFLRVLPVDLSSSQTALIEKALSLAELPVTEHNAAVVSALLSHRLPISKESILSLLKQSIRYGNANIDTLAFLNQQKLPVTAAVIKQYEAYQGFDRQILPQLLKLADSLGQLSQGAKELFPQLSEQLQRFFQTGSTAPVDMGAPATATSDAADLLPSAQGQDTTSTTPTDATGFLPSAQGQGTTSTTPTDATGFLPSAQGQDTTVITSTDATSFLPSAQGQDATSRASTDATGFLPSAQEQDATATTSTDGYRLLSSSQSSVSSVPTTILNQSGNAPHTLASFSAVEGAFTPPDFEVMSILSTVQDSSSPLDSPLLSLPFETSRVLEEETLTHLIGRWTLSLQELKDPAKVKDFYSRLREELYKLRSFLKASENTVKTSEALSRLMSDTAEATQNLQENLEFMNMLNRFFPYIQLPLRFSDKTVHSELYVYTKKESLRENNSCVSVLLHLDMDTLGPTDIFLSLTNQSLNVKFYLNEESQRELFSEHLAELKESLVEKEIPFANKEKSLVDKEIPFVYQGFEFNFELIPRKPKMDPVSEFLRNHDSLGLNCYSFDCRA